MPKAFEAKYAGQCANGDRIKVGDLVQFVDDELVHVECDGSSPTNSEGHRYRFAGTTLEEMGY